MEKGLQTEFKCKTNERNVVQMMRGKMDRKLVDDAFVSFYLRPILRPILHPILA
jgi:hypothetical protein